MTTRLKPEALLAAGLLLGALGDGLLRAPGAPGLNLLLWSAAVVFAAVVLHRRAGLPLSTEAKVLLGTGMVFSAGLIWRDAPALKLLALACAAAAYSLPALRAGAAWIRRSSIGEYIVALISSGVHAGGGAVPALAEVDWGALREGRQQTSWGNAVAAARGLVLAVPVVAVFGALFISADAVFAQMITTAIGVDLEVLASHLVLTGVLAWIATGYLRSFVQTGPRRDTPAVIAGARLGAVEGGVLLGLLNALFLVFVLVQFRYLFGGGALVEVTPGLTYAEYARRGFFELVAVVALTLPLLLASDWLLRDAGARGRTVFRLLAGFQVVLVLAVMSSAVQRMRLYQAAYGLTEQRLYATALLVLLGVVLVLFAVTVLRSRRHHFAFGSLVAAFATVATLFVINPDALIARTNMARVNAGDAGATRFDAAYVSALSGDAVPVLLAQLPALPAPARCEIAARLLRRWAAAEPLPLRSWSWSAARAQRAIRGAEHSLRDMAAAGPCANEDRTVATTAGSG